MTPPRAVVCDTNVLMDMSKSRDAADVPLIELDAAHDLMTALLIGTLRLAYSKGMVTEWTQKRLFEEDAIVRVLLDNEKLEQHEPRRLSRGQKQDLAKHVNYDDQVFVLTAAALEKASRFLLSRDPKVCNPTTRKYVKRTLYVKISLASEFSEAFLS